MVRQQTRKRFNRFKIEEKKAFSFIATDTKNGSSYEVKAEPGQGYVCQCRNRKQLKSPGKGMCAHKYALYEFLSGAGIAPLCEHGQRYSR